MIQFEKVRWKNFLSTGNSYTEVELNRSPSTLIVGSNGAGKSTMLDALSFALFGKPHRNIKKPQLINSINNKTCVVEVEFSIGNASFKVSRGLKPNKFEIYVNDKMVNQESNVRDYQKYLEQNILKLNHKSFHQVVVLGSSSFIPFMQLPSHHRREVIEDLLDINIFSKMNVILKDKNLKLKEEVKDVTYNVDLIKDKVEVQRKYLKEITQLNEETIRGKQNEIASMEQELSELQSQNSELSKRIEETQPEVSSEATRLNKKKQEVHSYKLLFKQEIDKVVKDAKFYEENENCPTCSQDISSELKAEKIEISRAHAKELHSAMEDAAKLYDNVESDLEKIDKQLSEINEWNSSIHSNNSTISRLQSSITAIETEISNLEGRDGDTSKASEKLNSLIEEKDMLADRKIELVDTRAYYDAALEMLKDSGIKTKIVREYLPVMNKLINHYLQVMDFFVQFNLDESFNETIKSRHRDAFNYASFSEGEKQRIDLALLFTWRQIARMKNSASTNLLILDETFDSSLDNDGIDNLLKILNTLEEGTNTFIISHKGDVLDGKFRSKIEFYKDRNFSKIKVS